MNKYTRYQRALWTLRMCEAKAKGSVVYCYTLYPIDWLIAKLVLWWNK
jgi:hypothetical protein